MPRFERRGLAAALMTTMLTMATVGSAAPDATPAPIPFVARYSVAWRGITAGHSTLELKQTGPNAFEYGSSNQAGGIFKLVFPRAIIQDSHFTLEHGEVKPSVYKADDGSPDPQKTVTLNFDWNAMRVRGTSEGKSVDVALQPGTQDDMSVQIALMLGLRAGHVPPSFWLINKDEVEEYQYTRDGEEQLDTPLGKLDTVIYRSHHEGSSRTTRLWLAPTLDYLPLRAEQTRKDKIEFAMHIESFKKS
jgi:Protein of unknown function (DUF3108)